MSRARSEVCNDVKRLMKEFAFGAALEKSLAQLSVDERHTKEKSSFRLDAARCYNRLKKPLLSIQILTPLVKSLTEKHMNNTILALSKATLGYSYLMAYKEDKRNSNSLDEAERLIKQVLHDPHLKRSVAGLWLTICNYKKMYSECDKILGESQTDDSDISFLISRMYHKLERDASSHVSVFESVQSVLAKYKKIATSQLLCLYELYVRCAPKNQSMDEMIAHLQLLKSENNSFYEVARINNLIGRAYRFERKYSEALLAYNAVVKEKKLFDKYIHWDALISIAVVHGRGCQDYQGCIDHLKKLILFDKKNKEGKLAPTVHHYALAHYNTAESYYNLGNLKEARVHAKITLDHEPHFAAAESLLGKLQCDNEKRGELFESARIDKKVRWEGAHGSYSYHAENKAFSPVLEQKKPMIPRLPTIIEAAEDVDVVVVERPKKIVVAVPERIVRELPKYEEIRKAGSKATLKNSFAELAVEEEVQAEDVLSPKSPASVAEPVQKHGKHKHRKKKIEKADVHRQSYCDDIQGALVGAAKKVFAAADGCLHRMGLFGLCKKRQGEQVLASALGDKLHKRL